MTSRLATGAVHSVLAIDARSLELKWAGIAWYIHGVLEELRRQLPDQEIVVLTQSRLTDARMDGLGVLNIHETIPFLCKLKPILWLKLRGGLLSRRAGATHFWGAAGILPLMPGRMNTAVTVHDLNHRIVPETMGLGFRIAYGLFLEKDAQRADRVFVNSEGTAARLKRFTGIKSDGTVHPVLRSTLLELTAVQPAALPKGSPFFLCAATNEPRKNFSLTLDTFLRLKMEGRLGDTRLVIVGDAGWKNGAVQTLLEAGRKHGVVHLGYVSNPELAWLFRHCAAFLFPSIYEGFGMPVQEARSLGARVICTDLPELREAGDEFCRYVEPTGDVLGTALEEIIRLPSEVPAKPYDRELFQREIRAFAKTFLNFEAK